MATPGEPHDKGPDSKVGMLLWVKRRNGSWWPGQVIEIVEVDEPSEGSMAPPTTVPVKLLGSDDPVDWYNIEKSKRIKSFRCGEFDMCIEKAKLAASTSSRKAMKNARRQDAIIRALEIERAQTGEGTEHTDDELSGFEGDDGSFHDRTECPNQVLKSSAKQSGRGRPRGRGRSRGRGRPRGTDRPRVTPTGRPRGRPRKTPIDSEDDRAEGVKRMRGLDDLGMGVLPAKKERSEVGNVHELLKKKNRHRPLSKVLESSPTVSVPVATENFLSPYGLRSNESKQRSSVVTNDLDNIGVPCENRVARRTRFGGTAPDDLRQKPSRIGTRGEISQSVKVEPVFFTEEEPSEFFSTSSDEGPKWTMKRKRTSVRHARPQKRTNASNDGDFNENLDQYFGWSSRRAVANSQGYSGAKISPITLGSLPDRQSRFVMNSKYEADISMRNQDGDFGRVLCDVKLEVQASSRGQHVPGQHIPYVSIMSQTANRPIVGHPLTVEILEEGSTEDLLKGAYISNSGSKMSTFVPEHGQKRKVGRPPRGPPKQLNLHRVSPEKSSKKIRKPSSLTGFSKGARTLVLEKIIEPVIACVPLKVAYSRLKAAFRRSVQTRRRVRCVVKRGRR